LSWIDYLLSLIRTRRPVFQPVAPVEPPPPQPDSQAERMMQRLNEARIGLGVAWLPAATTAMQAAEMQSDWQDRRNLMGHDGPPGFRTVGARLANFGQHWDNCGEIVAECQTFAEAVALWLESPGEDPRGITHRKILLDPNWTHAGVAMTGRYCTAVFFR
jgi:uncharacterized protein YkwD